MKKLLILVALLIIFAGYSIHERSEGNIEQLTTSNFQSSQQNSSTGQTNHAKFKDGVYSGNSENAFYGTIQVEATITKGKITDIKFLQYPHANGESIAVNTQAMPILKQEAIQSQTANVDSVTGATQTSSAFNQSLLTALTKAQ